MPVLRILFALVAAFLLTSFTYPPPPLPLQTFTPDPPVILWDLTNPAFKCRVGTPTPGGAQLPTLGNGKDIALATKCPKENPF